MPSSPALAHCDLLLRPSYPDILVGSDEHVTSIEGLIVHVNEQEEETTAGRFRIFLLDLASALESGTSIHELLDEHAELSEFIQVVDTEDNPTSALSKAADDYFSFDQVLVLDRLEVLPEFRGRGLGLLATTQIINHFARGSWWLALLKAFPLQFEVKSPRAHEEWSQSMRLGTLPVTQPTATAKLRKHYSRLGFKRVRGTDIMALNLDCHRPSA